MAYEVDNGDYILSGDALRTSAAIQRLLKKVGIKENEKGD
jgi:hypothetical protein